MTSFSNTYGTLEWAHFPHLIMALPYTPDLMARNYHHGAGDEDRAGNKHLQLYKQQILTVKLCLWSVKNICLKQCNIYKKHMWTFRVEEKCHKWTLAQLLVMSVLREADHDDMMWYQYNHPDGCNEESH